MPHGDLEIEAAKGRGEGGGGVPVDQDHVRLHLLQHRPELFQDGGGDVEEGLPVLHDSKIIVRRHLKSPQALGQHFPVLPRDADHRLKLLRPPLQLQHQGAHFDGLRLRSEDQHHFFHSFRILRPRAGDRPDLCLDGNISLRTMQSFSVCIVIASVI